MKKFLVTLLVAMLALTAVAFAAEVVDYDLHKASHAALIEGKDWELLKLDCTETGVCRHFLADNKYVDYILAPTGHHSETLPGEGEIVVEPDCTNKGVEKVVCDNKDPLTGKKCGETFERKIDTTSHVTGWYFIVAPTCSNYGIGAYGCPACGLVVDDQLYTSWKTHTADGDKTKIDGVTYLYDARCDKYTGDDVKKHTNLSGWLTISEDDCYNPLVKENYCRDCQKTIRFWENKVKHDFTGVSTKTIAVNNTNCKTVAVYLDVKYCKNCSTYYEAQLPTIVPGSSGNGNYNIDPAHLPTSVYNDPAIEALEDAIDKYFDSSDNAKKANAKDTGSYYVPSKYYLYTTWVNNEIGWKQGHHVVTEKSKVVVDDTALELITCKDEGNEKKDPWTDATCLYIEETYFCAVCKTEPAKVVRTALTAPAHEYTAWKEVVAPTEDTNFIGKWTRYCLECADYEEYIGGVCGKDNHLEDAPVLENVVEATYTAEGSAEEVIYCAVCKEELSRKDVVLPMLEGINPDDNTLYEDGKASTATGIVTVDGKDTYLINGVKQVNALGATLVGDQWYWMAHGVVAKVTGAQLYSGEWFYAENGKIDITKNGLIKHDGEQFWVACGRLTTEYTGLVQNGDQWILISAGRFADEYTGVVTYDGTLFNVENGIMVVK